VKILVILTGGTIGSLISENVINVKEGASAKLIEMYQEKEGNDIEFEVIQAAIQGDADSINQIISYFQPYINARCRRKFKDEFGHEHYMTDEYMKRRLETKLITKILDFKIQV